MGGGIPLGVEAIRMASVEAMKHHGPGWTVSVRPDHDYMLWAPQPDGPRQFWQASWDRNRGRRGGCLRGNSAEEVLACLPDDTEGRGARAALLVGSQDVSSPATNA